MSKCRCEVNSDLIKEWVNEWEGDAIPRDILCSAFTDSDTNYVISKGEWWCTLPKGHMGRHWACNGNSHGLHKWWDKEPLVALAMGMKPRRK
jgi:hypothetical protein